MVYILASGNGPALRESGGRVMARGRSLVRSSIAGVVAAVMIVAGSSLAAGAEPESFTTVPTPIITGTAAVGGTLEASFDSSAVDPMPDGAGLTWFVDGVNVGNGESLGLHPGDVGKVISVRLTVIKAGYNDGVAFSADTLPVALGTQASFTPKISGAAAVGTTLKITGLPSETTFSYQWKRNGSSISGAKYSTYKQSSSDLGKKISVVVTAKRAGYTNLTKTSASTATVRKAFSKSYSPKISGTAKVGYTLKATVSAWSPTASFKYQWYRDGVAISGATGTTRKLSSYDAGKKITVKVTGSRSGYYTLTKTSSSTSVVANGSITAATPKISGTAKVGNTLKVTIGTTSPSSVTKSYQWLRNGVAIAGATSSSYALKNVDAGKKISIKVKYVATGYAYKYLTSASTASIASRTSSMKAGQAYGTDVSLKGTEYYVAPGVYIANSATSACYWVRDDDFDASNGELAAYIGAARWMIEMTGLEVVFYSEGCGNWIRYDGSGAQSSSVSKDGMYRVDVDVRSGVYQRSGGTDQCYVTFEENATGEAWAIYHDEFPAYGAQVSIYSDDIYFTTWGCGTWTRVSDIP